MRIINRTCFNDKSLRDLIRHAQINSNVSVIRFVERSDKFLAEDSDGLGWSLGFADVSENGTEFLVKFCGNEFVNDKNDTSTVKILLHELEHVRQLSLGLDGTWSSERMENEACKAELNVRG